MKMRKRVVCESKHRRTSVLDRTLTSVLESAAPKADVQASSPRLDLAAPDTGGQTSSPSVPTARECPVLIVRGGTGDGETVPIKNGKLTIGSLPDNDLVIDEPGISRRHAEIFEKHTGYFLRDLGLANPTFVNQVDIGGLNCLLRHGDKIQLGSSTISHIFAGSAAMAAQLMIPFSTTESGLIVAGESGAVKAADTPAVENGSDEGSRSDGKAKPEEDLFLLSDQDIYEGLVRLRVTVDVDVRLVVNFVTELRQISELRLLRLACDTPTSVSIWLSLREPVSLIQMLGKMEAVGQVMRSEEQSGTTEGEESVVSVWLNGELSQNLVAGSNP